MTIEEIQAELQEEINLCNKYFIEEDMHKDSTEHERLALKIVTMCMQTLSALKDGELEDYKHIKQWKSDIMDEFCRYDCNSIEEAIHNGYIKAIDDFVKVCKGNILCQTFGLRECDIKGIAEQLKESEAE